MMGPSHALSGAAAWLAGSYALEHFYGVTQTPVQLIVGTAMCAGGALMPDMDLSGRVRTNRGGATVAHTFGVFSLFVAEVIEKVSLAVYLMTRMPADPKRNNGHRTLTHTLVFNVAFGVGAFELCLRLGKWAVVGTLFVTFAMALRGLFEKWARRAGWVIVTGVAAASTVWAMHELPAGRGYPILGLAIGVGGIMHLLGDMITSHGCPVLWPLPIGRRVWRNIGVPDAIAVEVGGTVEVLVLRAAFTVVAVLAALALTVPAARARYNLRV
jgi:membrane-bound metal-dependent hydrolase YbcI (DUF457 family)